MEDDIKLVFINKDSRCGLEIGKIYEVDPYYFDRRWELYEIQGNYYRKEEFITLAEFREQRINNILND